MKLITTAFFLGCLASALSQGETNLIANGDFNGLAPWTATGPVELPATGPGLIIQGGTPQGSEIAQTITTQANTTYYLTLQVTEASVVGSGNGSLWFLSRAGGPPFGVSDYVTDYLKPGRYAWVFRAAGPQTNIRIGVSNGEVRLTNVSVVELPPSPYAGRYVGIAKVKVAVGLKGPDDDILTASKTERVVARVLSTGQFIILRDTEEIATGLLFPNGDYSLRANGQQTIRPAQISGNRLKLTAGKSFSADGGLKIRDEGQAPLLNGTEIEFSLTRTGR